MTWNDFTTGLPYFASGYVALGVLIIVAYLAYKAYEVAAYLLAYWALRKFQRRSRERREAMRASLDALERAMAERGAHRAEPDQEAD